MPMDEALAKGYAPKESQKPPKTKCSPPPHNRLSKETDH